MIINIFPLILAALFLISASFYGLFSIGISGPDVILLISLITLIFYIKEFEKKTFYEDRYFYSFFIYSFFMSIIMAYLNFGQPIGYSMRAARLFITYAILIMSLNIVLKNLQIKKIYPFMVFVSFIIIFINFYVYGTGDISILVEGVGVLERLGEIRITIGTFTSIVFIFYFYHKLKENRWAIVPLLGLLLAMIVVSKTRSILFPILIIMIIPLLRAHKAQVVKIWIGLGGLVLLSFMVSGYEKSILSPIVDLFLLLIDESQTVKHSNVNIRGIELVYFWSFLDIKSMIFGYGMENILFKELYNIHFFLSDIGLFKIFYYHGVLGFILYIYMHWGLYKVSKKNDTPLHFTGRAIVYFQILSPSSVFFYSIEYMFLFFVVYILIKNKNIKVEKE